MKLRTHIALAIAALSLVAAPVLYTGCIGPRSQVAIYKTLASTQVAVDSARKSLLEAFNAGRVTQTEAARALEASTKFNTAFNAAVVAAGTSEAPTPANVASAATEFLLLVSTLLAK